MLLLLAIPVIVLVSFAHSLVRVSPVEHPGRPCSGIPADLPLRRCAVRPRCPARLHCARGYPRDQEWRARLAQPSRSGAALGRNQVRPARRPYDGPSIVSPHEQQALPYTRGVLVSRWSVALQRMKDARDDRLGRFVLPRPENGPSVVGKEAVRFSVPLAVAAYLLSPERSVRLRDRVMCGAPVPEAAVDENRDLGAREHEVCTTVQRRNRAEIDPVPKSRCVCSSSDRHLGLGVASSVRLHAAPDAGGGRP